MRFAMICKAKDITRWTARPNHPSIQGQVERMNRTIKEATVKRSHHQSHDQLLTGIVEFMAAYDFAFQLETPSGPTLCEHIAEIRTS